MTNETLQFETQAVDIAEKELARARKIFEEQLNTYKTVSEQALQRLTSYRQTRRFWLE